MALHTGTVGPVIRADNMEPEVLRQLVSISSGERDGIVRGTDFAVTQNGGGAMSVLVSSGLALLTGTDSARVQGQYHLYNDASVTVTVPTANGSNPRVDLIGIALSDVYYGGATNAPTLVDIAGTPGASPGVPATPNDFLVLAHVYVGTAVGSILTAAINGTAGAGNPDTIAFTPMRCEGVLGNASVAAVSGGTSTASPGTALPGLVVNVNVGANRLVRVRWALVGYGSGAAQFFAQARRDGSTMLGSATRHDNGASQYTYMGGEVFDSAPPAGVHQYTIQLWNQVANTISGVTGTLSVEDAGPV